jgi:hypothetical protein
MADHDRAQDALERRLVAGRTLVADLVAAAFDEASPDADPPKDDAETPWDLLALAVEQLDMEQLRQVAADALVRELGSIDAADLRLAEFGPARLVAGGPVAGASWHDYQRERLAAVRACIADGRADDDGRSI